MDIQEPDIMDQLILPRMPEFLMLHMHLLGLEEDLVVVVAAVEAAGSGAGDGNYSLKEIKNGT
jgi:hypothetical protein